MARLSPPVAVDSSFYDLIDSLEAHHCAQATYRGLRPQSYLDLRSALALFENEKENCAAPEWLLAEREILIQEGQPAEFRLGVGIRNEEVIPLPGIDAVVSPNYPMRQGRPDFYGANLAGELAVSGATGQNFGVALSANPGFVAALEDYAVIKGRAYLQEWNAKLGVGRWEASMGRTALQVGGPKHGSLLLSHGSKPMNLWKLALRPSFSLDGTPTFLGPFSIETWLADAGESERGISRSKLWGVGLGARPFPFFEFSLLELYQWGGDGAPTLTGNDVLSMLYYSTAPQLNARRQAQLLVDFVFWGPDRFFKWYSQLLFGSLEFSEETGYLTGIWFPKLGAFEARAEYVYTGRESYTHPIWVQGMTYQGTPLGHPVGPGGQAFYFDLGVSFAPRLRTTLGTFYEVRGQRRSEPVESRLGGSVEVSQRWQKLLFSVTARYAHIQNLLFMDGEKKDAFSLWAQLKYSLF